MSLLVLVTGLGLAAYTTYWLLYEIFFNPLRKIPGPFLARFTILWEVWTLYQGSYLQDLLKLHEKHGDYIRIAPNRISCTSVDSIKKIYALGSGYPKSAYYDGSGDPAQLNLFNARDVKAHGKRKRQVGSMYTMSTVVNYEEAVDRSISTFNSQFAAFATDCRSINMHEFLQAYAFDVIGEITFDRSFGLMESGTDTTGLLKVIHTIMVYQNYVPLLPGVHQVLVSMTKLLGLTLPNMVINKLITQTLESYKEYDFEEKKDTKATPFFAKAMQLCQQGKADQQALYDSCSSNIVAGADSTSAALSSAVYHIYSNTSVLQKLRAEIDSVAPRGPTTDPISFNDTNQMAYLQAVIKEALRIAPPTGHVLPREVPAGGVTFDNFYLPQKTEVGASSWALHHNSRLIEYPHIFKPERFLDEGNTETNARMAMNFAFGGGSRSCLGKNISLLEMTKLIPDLVRKYDLEFIDLEKGMQTSCHTFFLIHSFKCRVKLRN